MIVYKEREGNREIQEREKKKKGDRKREKEGWKEGRSKEGHINHTHKDKPMKKLK